MRSYLLMAGLLVAMGSVAKGDVLTIDFKTTEGKAKLDGQSGALNPTNGSGWFSNLGAGTAVQLFYGGTQSTASNPLTLFTKAASGGSFTATANKGILTLNHSFGFAYGNQNNEPLDGGYLAYRVVGTTDWTQILTNTGGQTYNSTSLPVNPSFALSNTLPQSTFEFNTVAGSSYEFAFRGIISATGTANDFSSWTLDSMQVVSVPEPSTLVLGSIASIIAGGGFGLRKLRRRNTPVFSETEEENAVSE